MTAEEHNFETLNFMKDEEKNLDNECEAFLESDYLPLLDNILTKDLSEDPFTKAERVETETSHIDNHQSEANILDRQGNIDMPNVVLTDYLDIVLAGFHELTGYGGTSTKHNTQAMIAAIKNPYVHIITHPGNPKFPVHVEEVVLVAKKYNKALELNNSSFIVREGSFAQCDEFAKMAKKHNALVCINSDAHICYNVGENANAMALAAKSEINKNQIINYSVQQTKDFLVYHKQQLEQLAKAL